jgi:hypothetical protein
MVYLYGAVGKTAASPLLATRLVSGTAAFLTALLLFGCTWYATRAHPTGRRFLACVSIVLLWLTSHLFEVTSGRTWNHDLPCLLAVGAMALLLFPPKLTRWHWLAAGLLAGLATGGRLTIAPFAGLLPLTALLWPGVSRRQKFSHLCSAGIGTALALLPSASLYLQSPDSYLFGNFEFPRLPLLAEDNSRILKTISPLRKIRYFFKELVRSNLPLALSMLGLLALYFRQTQMSGANIKWLKRCRDLPWHWIVPPLALLAGAFAPSRYEMQHFYIVAPLAALLAARALTGASPRTIHGLAAAAVVSCALGASVFAPALELPRRKEWSITRIQRDAAKLRTAVPSGKVLTLAPILPIEAGLSIYPQLATGRFGWKFAHLVPQPRREKLHLTAEEDLEAVVRAELPAAVLTGLEDAKLEKSIRRYAERNGYLPESLNDKVTLWIRPG